MKRKPISKKVRFDIFKRDSFTCQYCGNTPPSIILEIDHIHPFSKGGDNDIDNLVTACFDCNRGKSAETLDSVPRTLVEKSSEIKEREEQLRGLIKLKSSVKARKTKQTNMVANTFSDYFTEHSLTESAKLSIRTNFLPHLDVSTLIENMEIACQKQYDKPHAAFKYFCGICWNMIKENQNG